MKRLFALAIAVFLAGAGASGQAHALAIELSPGNPPVLLDSTTNIGAFHAPVIGDLSWSADFRVAFPAFLTGELLAVVNMSSFSLSLVDLDTAMTTLLATAPGVFAYAGILDPTHTFRLVANGTALFPFGTFTGFIQVAPIPLPAAFPLLAAGVVALGAFARRRRSKARPAVGPSSKMAAVVVAAVIALGLSGGAQATQVKFIDFNDPFVIGDPANDEIFAFDMSFLNGTGGSSQLNVQCVDACFLSGKIMELTNISQFSLTLESAAAGLPPTVLTTSVGNFVYATALQPTVEYLLTLTAQALSPIGAYSGTLQFTLTPPNIPPIPIPAALPLFAAGLAALGAFARRRRSERQEAAA